MRTSNRILTATAAALLLGFSFTSAQALDLSIGGISASIGSSGSGGTTATVGVGGTSTSATIGGGSNLASSSTSTGDTILNLGVSSTDGPLLTTSSSDGTTDADVNLGLFGLGGTVNDTLNTVTDPLGNLLDGIALPGLGDGGGGGAGGNGLTPAQLASAFGSLGPGEQQLLRNRCRAVLTNPAAFDPSLRELCRIIARMQVGLN